MSLCVRQLGELANYCYPGAPDTDLPWRTVYPILFGSTRHATDIRQNVLHPLISHKDPTRAIASPSRRILACLGTMVD
jgi:hypothetical protein